MKQPGDRFGRLVLVEESAERRNGKPSWVCRCDCGNTIVRQSTNVGAWKGAQRSCGCLRVEKTAERSSKRKPGERFGRLVLVERTENDKHNHPRWLCVCDCGRETVVDPANLTRADGKGTQSCGCLHKERVRSKNPLLSDYKQARRQTFRLRTRPNRKLTWDLTFEQYHAIVTKPCAYCGSPPSQETKVVGVLKNGIDRVDSSGGYHAENCVPCCATCNVMKGPRTVSEFMDHVKKIHDFLRPTKERYG